MANIRWKRPGKIEPEDIGWSLPKSLTREHDFIGINCVTSSFISKTIIIRSTYLNCDEREEGERSTNLHLFRYSVCRHLILSNECSMGTF